jgi:hypothetical protein
MTNPPQDDDHEGGPVRPPRPAPGSEYGRTWQPPVPPAYGQGYGPQAPPPGWEQAPYAGPPYGQPFYGPPPGQPQLARKSRAGVIAAIAGAVLLLVVGGIVLAFALRSEVLDPRAVERDVAAQFEQREGVAIDLDCADRMKVESGASYECTGTTADDEPVTLRITITDEENATYTWTEP